MPGPQGFERFNTTTDGSGRGRKLVSGLPGLSLAPAAIRHRLKLLAVISVAVGVAAYAGPGMASGGSETPVRLSGNPGESSSVDQYDGGAHADRETDATPRRTPPEQDLATSRTGSGLPHPVPFSYHSFNKDISAVGGDPASEVTKDGAGTRAANTGDGAEAEVSRANAVEADASPQKSSAPTTPVSYNAEPYCRTYERGGAVRPSTKARAVFPLPEEYLDSYDDTWGAARPQGGHEGTDLMSPTGTPQYAITDGTVVPVSGSNANGWNYLGGYTVMVRAAHGIGPVKKGDLFYYAHMDRETPLPIGTEVEAGDQVGVVGDTGYGGEGTRGQFPPHLHLGWYDVTGATSEVPSGAMNPYPLLEWLKRNGGTASGGWGPERASEGYCDYQERTAAEPPATNEGGDDGHDHDLPPGVSSGSSADLDTGSPDPRPSPVVERRDHSSHSHSRAVAHTSRPDHGPPRARSREGGNAADFREGRDPRPAPEPAPDGRRDAEPAGEGDPGSTRSDRPDRTPERETAKPETNPSSNPAPEEPREPAPSGRPSPDGAPWPRPEPEPDKPEPDKPEPDKPEPTTPVAAPEEPAPSRPGDDAPEPGRAETARRASLLPVAFHDEDADGVRDSGEPELTGWPVELGDPDNVGATGRTGDRVSGLEPGTYRVTVEAASGYAGATPETVRVRVTERREARPSFGFVELAELEVLICGEVRGDEPCAREAEEFRRWELRLLDGKGRLISEAATGRDGEHRFPDLRPGVYELIFAPRHGGSSGEPETRRLTLTGSESRSVELRWKDSPAQRERREKPPETPVETPREEDTEDTEEERP